MRMKTLTNDEMSNVARSMFEQNIADLSLEQASLVLAVLCGMTTAMLTQNKEDATDALMKLAAIAITTTSNMWKNESFLNMIAAAKVEHMEDLERKGQR